MWKRYQEFNNYIQISLIKYGLKGMNDWMKSAYQSYQPFYCTWIDWSKSRPEVIDYA